MDRSSRQLARSERLDNSPYRRPQAQHAIQPRSPISSFPSLRSIYSFVTAPFARQPLLPQTNQDLPIEEDQKSQSGSEDGWNGSPPPGMEGQDLFSVASAGGRRGEEFDRRAIEYRNDVGDNVNGKAGPSASTSILPLHYPPGSRREEPLTPSAGASSSKRSLGSTFSESTIRKPLPSFLPTAQTAAPPQSAASIAFSAFVEAKRGQAMTPEDMRIMRTLMDNIEAEQGSGAYPKKTGGWSAGIGESPRPLKGIPNGISSGSTAPATPNRLVDSVRGNGGPMFTVGTPGGRSDAGSVRGESPASRRIRYLGPGMSPRRMLNKSRTADKPVFTSDVAEESEPKRQRVDEASDTPQKVDNQTPAYGSPMQIDTPAPTPSKIRALEKARSTTTPARPSPLGQSPESTGHASPREASSIAEGKKRAADIVKELMEEELGSVVSLNKRDYMVINPYDMSTPASTSQVSDSASSSLSKSVIRSATPKKSILRSSLRSSTSTPLSGAAAKLEEHKPGRKLTTLELLEGKKPWAGPIVDETMRSQTPSPSRDAIEIDESMEESPAPTPPKEATPLPPSPARESRPMPKMPEPFKAPSFRAPDVSSPARTIPTFASTPSPSKHTSMPLVEAPKQADTPVFSIAPPKLSEPLPEIENSTLASIKRTPKTTPPSNSNAVPTRIPAQNSAMQSSANTLPTFTFTISAPKSKVDEAVKTIVMSRPIERFDFDLNAAPAPISNKSPSFAALGKASFGPEWTCSTCMLKNPDSFKEKCTICEAPRPSDPAPAKQAAPPAADWTCSLCMLKNPDSAKEKCTVCEAPRPAAGTSSTPSFGFGQPPMKEKAAERKPGPWTCDLCMLQNPESATDKCQICEAKRP